jgi:hypothetical protein
MTDAAIVPRMNDDRAAGPAPQIDERLADQLLGMAQAEGVELPGSDGLLFQATKAVLERALAGEVPEHLGCEKHDPARCGSGSSRNGISSKTLLTDFPAPSRWDDTPRADRQPRRRVNQLIETSRAHGVLPPPSGAWSI